MPWASVFSLRALLAGATALTFALANTIVVPYWRDGPAQFKAIAVDVIPEALRCRIQDFGRYLGVSVGPGAHEVQWGSVIIKLLHRGQLGKLFGGSFCSSLRGYKVSAVSAISYVAQFAMFPPKALKADANVVQRLLSAPWQANHHGVLCALRNFGFSDEASSLYEVNRAALWRTACSSATFWGLRYMLGGHRDGDDEVLLRPRCHGRARHSVFSVLSDNFNSLSAMPLELCTVPARDLQRRTAALLRGQREDPTRRFIARRVTRWLLGVPSYDAEYVPACLDCLCSLRAEHLAFAVVRAFANVWCTSRRFQEVVRPCLCLRDFARRLSRTLPFLS